MRAFLSRITRRIKLALVGFVAILAALFGVSLLAVDANLTWTAPTTLANGQPLVDLTGYRVYYSQNGEPWEQIANVTSPSYLHADIGDGQHCYRVTAYRVVSGQVLESEPSNVACKTVDRALPSAPGGLTVQ